MSSTALTLPRRFASLVKFEHTIFALPFAYVGAFLSVDGYPGTANLVWITLAMLAAFAGLTLAAALAGLYLWQARRLKQRDVHLLRLRLPPLESLDRLSARTAAVSLAVLTAGIVVGLASFDRGDFDVPMAVTLAIWALYATGLVLRREIGLRGRRFAFLLIAGFVLVAVVLPLTHFAS